MSDSEEETPEKQLKVVFLGEPNVGKTSIIRRFCYDEYTRQYTQTVGADFFMRRMVLPGRKEVTVRISDVGGLELRGHMLENYLFNSDIILLVYDITSSMSFHSLTIWLDAINRLITKANVCAIIGNKCDLEHQRVIRLDRTKDFVNEHKLTNYFVSAKTGEGVNTSMTELVAKYFGIPLTRVEKERQVPIVRAELVPASAEQHRSVTAIQSNSNSSVCCIQ